MTNPDPPPLPWADAPYSIKQHGLTISNCDREPVQTPGCVQAHGVLLVVCRDDLTILQISENSADHLGMVPQAALGRRLEDLITPSVAAQVAAVVAQQQLEASPLCVTEWHAPVTGALYDVIVHTKDNLLLTELVPAVREGSSINYYELVKGAVGRLQGAATVAEFSEILAREVRSITGLDRAMIYRFHPDFHGEVFAESRRDDLPSWKGLHYPAEDIPQPAREIFRQIWLRPVPDIDGALAEMVPLANPLTGRALPMTHCVLRGASVMYTEYLRNMKVTAALTMSLRDGGELWGMIACHHYSGPKALNVHARSACELLAQVASLLIRKIEEHQQLRQRLEIDRVHEEVLARAAVDGDLRLLVEGAPSLLSGIPCGGVALHLSDRWWCVGDTPDDTTLNALGAWLAARPELGDPARPVFATDSLVRAYAAGATMARQASGVLAVAIGDPRTGLLVWFRPETIQSVNWAGNPHDKPRVPGPHGPRLTPRASFELYVESVKQRSLPWENAHLEAALRLRQFIQNIVVTRTEQISRLNLQLSASNEELDSFAHIASHDLKEPLRGIYKYAHQLLADSAIAGEEDRGKLDRLIRLTSRMNTLLDSLLHYSRVGRMQLLREDVDLNDLVTEARESLYAMVAERRSVKIVLPRPLPVHNCDPVRVREIFTNLLSNSLKYTTTEHGQIEIGFFEPGHPDRPAEAPRGTERDVVFYVRDNGIGIPRRHFGDIFELFRRLHPREAYGGGSGAGLTIVKRVVERHGGLIWLSSAEGEGTTFYFTLPHPAPFSRTNSLQAGE